MYEETKEKMLFFEITNKCNLNCLHCYNSSGVKMENELSLEQIKMIAHNFKNIGGNVVCISGGEPFAHKNFEEIVYIFIENGIENLRLGTNGLLINEKNKNILKYFQIISISLDGFEKEHNTIRGSKCFEKSLYAINAAIEAIGSDRVEVSTVLIKESLQYVEEYVKWLISIGVKHLNVSVPGVFGKKWICKLGEYNLSKEFRTIAFEKVKHLSRKYISEISISQTLFSKPVPVLDDNVYNCNCIGDMVPSVGGTPPEWSMGKAFESFERDSYVLEKLAEIQREMDALFKKEKFVFWWEELYRRIMEKKKI